MSESEKNSGVISEFISNVEAMLIAEASIYNHKQIYSAARAVFEDENRMEPVMYDIAQRARCFGSIVPIDFSYDMASFVETRTIVHPSEQENAQLDIVQAASKQIETLQETEVVVMAITYSENSGQELVHVVEKMGIIAAVGIMKNAALNWDEVENSATDVQPITDGNDELMLVIMPAVSDRLGRLYADYSKERVVVPLSKLCGVFKLNQ